MKTKKIPYYVFLAAMTAGASLTLGFLSFTGAMALWPALGFGVSFFVLSVAYEGEIYLQNIKGALHKLFQVSYIKRQLASEFLMEHLPETIDETSPTFLQDYAKLLQLEQKYQQSPANKENKRRLKNIQKSLKQADLYFTKVLFDSPNVSLAQNNLFTKELKGWIAQNQGEARQKTLLRRKRWYQASLAFSAICALLMGLGTVYLLTGSFLSIPMFAALPLPVLGIGIAIGAVFSGLAYGLLTYNSLVDMINNDTLTKWYQKIKLDLRENFGLRSIAMASAALALTALSLVMTICTAGTWWTIIKETPRVFSWMKHVPNVITAACMPFFLGLSSLIFNVENTAETLENIDDSIKNTSGTQPSMLKNFINNCKNTWQKESMLQLINPFRILLKLSYTPLRIVLFIGHLLSIAVTSDRLPGMSESLSALLGFLQEGFTDVNYFFDTTQPSIAKSDRERLQQRLDGGHEHDHNGDIPSVLLKWAFSPLFAAAALWHFIGSNKPYTKANLLQSWKLQFEPQSMHQHSPLEATTKACEKVSDGFTANMMLSKLQQWHEKHGDTINKQDNGVLTALSTELQSNPNQSGAVLEAYKTRISSRLFSKLARFDMREQATPTANAPISPNSSS